MRMRGKLRALLFEGNDPYKGFPYEEYPSDVFGLGSTHPNFEALICELRPRLIVEVGSWKGASAIHMAGLLRRESIEGHILCVDTWLGGLEIWLNKRDPNFYKALKLKHGHPTVYYEFLANVMRNGFQDTITPFPQTSLTAARWLKSQGIIPGLVYIDASHEDSDVYSDIEAFWELVKPSGAIFGDDFHKWEGVRSAVRRFSKNCGVDFVQKDRQWIIYKPDS